MPKVKACKGFRYPKSKRVLDAIKDGKAASTDVETWVRVKKGNVVTVPEHVLSDLTKMGAVELEKEV